VPDPEPERWLHPSVELRPSEIAGRGLFAREDLPARTVVLRLARGDESGERASGLGTSFPNHCCDPNLGWVDERGLATINDVSAGEELLTDYAMSIVDQGWFLRCHCPSYRCRQMVEGTDWRIRALQRRYAGWWAPHVQQLIDSAPD
jgi:SET domain-containing protein